MRPSGESDKIPRGELVPRCTRCRTEIGSNARERGGRNQNRECQYATEIGVGLELEEEEKEEKESSLQEKRKRGRQSRRAMQVQVPSLGRVID
ncbi:hypothetical protein PDE_05483 [Penicillium oxalicum 114-2]|uniref:Uncharacterized protein n=1 Tax=Penicillium oxalicum (strain 114-2 / CGMCC 5302) TaxID=933388 RepID=S7ZPF4_PENO1|nr:hypothetical protein PDE_05483 [Penicillium oxalicum 114-2]